MLGYMLTNFIGDARWNAFRDLACESHIKMHKSEERIHDVVEKIYNMMNTKNSAGTKTRSSFISDR
jgi:hypothetical protein